MKLLLSALAALFLLQACATGSGPGPSLADLQVLARDDRFALVRLQPGQDFGDLASVFLGARGEAWQLREVNADHSESPGQVVAVPLQPTNPSSVYPDGYRVLPILCYHQFTPQREGAHRLELSAAAFESQLAWLSANGYQTLSFADVEAILHAGRPIPDKAVVLTIDDGYRSVYEVAWPLLQKYQARATLFIYTDFIGAGAGLSWAQLAEMNASSLVEVQSHAMSHTSLAPLPGERAGKAYRKRLEGEISGAGAAFQRHLGQRPVYLSYPYGNSSPAAAQVLEQSGYALAATVTRGDNTAFADPYLLHRSMIYNDHDIGDFARLVRGFRRKNLQ